MRTLYRKRREERRFPPRTEGRGIHAANLVTRVRVDTNALRALNRLIVTHSLPANTGQRVQRILRPLDRFPRIGRELEGDWAHLRYILGPWRWMLVIYEYDEDNDVVIVVAFHDARSSTAATSQ